MILISLIKPTYIIFILLPILISNSQKIKELKKIFLFTIFFLFIYLLSYLNNPVLFNQFLKDCLKSNLKGGSTNRIVKDISKSMLKGHFK